MHSCVCIRDVLTQHLKGTGKANAFSTGITSNGLATGTITFTVPADAPDMLFYNCEYHAAMTGTISVKSCSSYSYGGKNCSGVCVYDWSQQLCRYQNCSDFYSVNGCMSNSSCTYVGNVTSNDLLCLEKGFADLDVHCEFRL